jgi:uracil-DNA glycosylase family 4
MGGFFTKAETESKSRPDGKIYSCISCGAYKSCVNPKMPPQGNGKIMIIGSAPTSLDDKRGLLFQGKIGKLVETVFDEFDIDIFKNCILTNAFRCNLQTAEENRTPTNYEIDCCRKSVLKSIQELKPKVIFLLGDEAIYSVIGHRWKKDLDKIVKWRGWQIPDQDLKCWLVPIYDPKKVDACKGPEMYNIWKADIKNGLDKLKEKFPIYEEPVIDYLE